MADELGEAAARRAQVEAQWREALRVEHGRLVEQLVELRIKLGLTQEQVAVRVGVSRGQIANAETGRTMLSVESLIGYVNAVGGRLIVEVRDG